MTVQENLESALQVAFAHWGRCWCVALMLLVVGMMGMMFWAQVVLNKHGRDRCDQPLAAMLRYLFLLIAVQALRKEIVRYILCYDVSRDGPNPPCRVVLFQRMSFWATLFWPIMAYTMLGETKTCSPELKLVVASITIYYAVLVVVVVLAPACCVTIVFCLIRRGIVIARSATAAPANFISSLPEVAYDPTLFTGDGSPGTFATQCSICLDNFDTQSTIKRTNCRPMPHVFHASCLEGWLGLSRTCPICRSDLVAEQPGQP